MKYLILSVLCAMRLFAQIAPTTAPTDWIAAGGAYSSTPGAKFSGIASFGVRLASANAWSYTTIQATSVSAIGSASANSVSVRTGVMTQVAGLGPTISGDPLFRLCTLADVGGSTPATGGIVGSFSGRGVAIVRLGKSGWHVALDVGMVKSGASSAPMVAVLFGKGF